jgi:chromosome segregation ATPase
VHLKREVERLREELAERERQIAEQTKRIADLERQLALRNQNSTITSKPRPRMASRDVSASAV